MTHPEIEPLDDDRYLVRIQDDEGPTTILVRASAAVIARLSHDNIADIRVIEAAIEYLVARQRADDLPSQLDIEDVAAFYGDFENELRQRLHGHDT